jgi:hypothetical protein
MKLQLVSMVLAGLAAWSAMDAVAQGSRVLQTGLLVNQGSRLCAEVVFRSSRDGVNVHQGDCRSGLGDWDVVDVGNGEVAFRNRATGAVLDVSGGAGNDGANVQQYTWNSSPAQRWRMEGGRLVNSGSGKCLDVDRGSRDAGANLHQWSCHGQASQQWRLESNNVANHPGGTLIGDRGFGRPGDPLVGGGGTVATTATGRPQGRLLYSGMIHSRSTGKCADVADASTTDGADVRQWSCNGTKAQLWDAIDVGRGELALVAQNSNRVMEVTGQTRTSGADVVQRGWNGGANQRWRIEPWDQGFSRIVNVGSGKCLDLEAGRGEDGVNIAQYDCHGGQNQQWRFEIRGSGNDSGWRGYRPRDNWWGTGRLSYDEPPAYLVGDFKTSDGYYGSSVDLSIYSDGVVIAKVDGGQQITGYFRNNQIYLGNYRYDVAQERTGFRVTPSGQTTGGVVYARARYESPRRGRN